MSPGRYYLSKVVTSKFAPDLDDYPTLEIPDLRRKAQKLLHTMVGADISPEEYIEKLELIETFFRGVYQEAVELTRAQYQYQTQRKEDLHAALSRPTRRPSKTDPGIGLPTIPPPSPIPSVADLEIDWSDFENE